MMTTSLNKNSKKLSSNTPLSKWTKPLRKSFILEKHDLLKLRAQHEVDMHAKERRHHRLDVLELIVQRAFMFGAETGEVIIGKDQDTLGDDGLFVLEKHCCDPALIKMLTISSHDIGPAGMKRLSFVLSQSEALKDLNLSGNKLGTEGAAILAVAINILPALTRLNVSTNQIGIFPQELMLCTALTELNLQHNRIQELPFELGLHPSLTSLNVLKNPIRNIKQENILSSSKVLKELFEGMVAAACEKARANSLEQPAILSKHVTYSIDELNINVPDRWNHDFGFMTMILTKYSELRSLNQLHEWPRPPSEINPSWDLSGRLLHPSYEGLFVRNRVVAAPFLTSLDLRHNSLGEAAAGAIAEAILFQTSITELDVRECCIGKVGMAKIASSVTLRRNFRRVNGLQILSSTEWDFRGAIVSIIETSFVTSKILEFSCILVSLDLRRNTISADECGMISDAVRVCQCLSAFNALSPSEQSSLWDLRKKLINGRRERTDAQRDLSPDRSSREKHDCVEARIGFLPAELIYIGNVVSRSKTITELDLSANELKDDGINRIAQFILPNVPRLSTLHLHQNGITKIGATSLGKALQDNIGIECLRMNENLIGQEGVAAIISGFVIRKEMRPKNHTGVWGRVIQLYFDETNIGPTLPENISQLLTLEVLSLRCNHVTTLSANLCLLTNLTSLTIEANPIEFPRSTVIHQGLSATMKFLRNLYEFGVVREAHFKKMGQLQDHTYFSEENLVAKNVEMEAKMTVMALTFGAEEKKDLTPPDRVANTIRTESVSNLNRHGREILGMAFGPKIMATCSSDCTVKLWVPENTSEGLNPQWLCCNTLAAHHDDVRSVSFGSYEDNTLLASGSSDGTVRVWRVVVDRTKGEPVNEWICAQVLTVKYMEDKCPTRHVVNVVAIHASKEGMYLASGTSDGIIHIWGPNHVNSGRPPDESFREKLMNSEEVLGLRNIFDEFCQKDMFGRSAARNKRLAQSRSSRLNFRQTVAFCEETGILPFVGKAIIFNLFREVMTFANSKTGDLDFSSFGTFLWRICMAAERETPFQDCITSQCRWTPFGTLEAIADVHIRVLEALFSPFAQSDDKETLNFSCLYELQAHDGDIHGLVWVPSNSSCLASCSADETVKLWQYSEKKGRGSWAAVYKGQGHEGPVLSLCCAVSHSKTIFASTSNDGSVLLWDLIERHFDVIGKPHVGYTLRKGQRMHHDPGNAVCGCSFRQDGALLATVDDSGRVLLWSMQEGRWSRVAAMDLHRGKVAACCFGNSENVGLLVTGGHDFSIHLLDTTHMTPARASVNEMSAKAPDSALEK